MSAWAASTPTSPTPSSRRWQTAPALHPGNTGRRRRIRNQPKLSLIDPPDNLSSEQERCGRRIRAVAAVGRIHPLDRGQILRVQLEVEDLEIADDAVLVNGLRDDDQPFLQVPSDDGLRYRLAVFFGDAFESRIAEQPAAAERAPA